MIDKIKQYWNDTRSEMSKVTWPSKDELTGSTIVVIIVSLVLGVFIFGVDLGLGQLMRLLLGF